MLAPLRTGLHRREVLEVREPRAASALEHPADAIAQPRPRIGKVREHVMRRPRPHRDGVRGRIEGRLEMPELAPELLPEAGTVIERAQIIDLLVEAAPRVVQHRLVELAARAQALDLALLLDAGRARAQALRVAELVRALDELAALVLLLHLLRRRGRLAVIDVRAIESRGHVADQRDRAVVEADQRDAEEDRDVQRVHDPRGQVDDLHVRSMAEQQRPRRQPEQRRLLAERQLLAEPEVVAAALAEPPVHEHERAGGECERTREERHPRAELRPVVRAEPFEQPRRDHCPGEQNGSGDRARAECFHSSFTTLLT